MRIVVGVVLGFALYGFVRMGTDVLGYIRTRKVRRAFQAYWQERVEIERRFASGLALMARPELPPSWRAMLAGETEPVPAMTAAERRAVN